MEENFVKPIIGTPDEAKQKLIDSYNSFVDSSAKFVSLADFYSEPTNSNKAAPVTFQDQYSKNYQALKNGTIEDFAYSLSHFAALYLDYVDDIKDNLNQYTEILKGQDPSLSDYDKACDLLSIRDEFTDLENTLNEANRAIANEKSLETHYGDEEYDPAVNSLKVTEEAKTEEK